MKQTTIIICECDDWRSKYTLTENEDGVIVSLSSYNSEKIEETYTGKSILIDKNEFIEKTKEFMDELNEKNTT